MKKGILPLSITMSLLLTSPVLAEVNLNLDSSANIENGGKIAVVGKKAKGQFWDTIKKGMDKALDDVNKYYKLKGSDKLSIRFETGKKENDVDSQINTLDAVLSENPIALCLSAVDMDSCQAQLESAKENGIPVISFDSNVSEKDLISSFVGTDNKKLGELAAKALSDKIGDAGEVIVFSAPETTEIAKDRVNSFKEYLKDKPNIKIDEVVYEKEGEKTSKLIEKALKDHPNVNGVFCNTSSIAKEYLGTKPSNNIAMVGVDGTKKEISALKSGKEIAIVSQNAFEMGYETIISAVKASINDKTLKNKTLFEPKLITKDNYKDKDLKNYIY